MKILNIASIKNSKGNGVHVVVPQYVMKQAEYVETAFVNVNGITIDTVKDRQIQIDDISRFCDEVAEKWKTPDLVVFNEVNKIQYIKIYKQLLRRGIPYIIIPHGSLASGALKKKWLKKKLAYTLFFNKFIRNAKAIQCLSQNEIDNIKIKTAEKFIATNGINLPKIYKQNFSDNGLRLAYIGRLEMKIKGLDLMIDAIANIKEICRDRKITLDIYGPDVCGRRNELEEYISARGVGDIVKVHDPVYDGEKEKEYLSHDIFIQTSRHEGMPVGILETFSYGIPCIITDGTGLVGEMMEYGAGYGAGNSAESIANAVITAVNGREEWINKGNNARRLVKDRYLWDNIMNETIEEYSKIIKR